MARLIIGGFLGFLLAASLFITTSVLIAWTGPSAAPPTNNVSAPINVGTIDQIKNAGIGINSLAVFGNAILNGTSRYFNFGTTSGSGGYGIRDNNGVIEYKNSGGSWTPLSSGGSGGNTSFTISSSANNVDLYVVAGSPATAGNYTITINSGVTIGSVSTGVASLSSGTWPAGSTVTLINNGNIYGRGGDGGAGGSGGGGSTGGTGGNALSLSYDLTINNTNGYIFGGGGGGGGGTGTTYSQGWPSPGVTYYSGGTGGTGQGSATVSGPTGGSAGGGNGSASGGSGGVFGAAGSSGGSVSGWGSGGGGGAAGKAAALNSKTITWLGGNDSTHVKGAVQ